MMWWGMPDGFGWWMMFGGLWMVLFWVAIIAAIIWGVRALGRRDEEPQVREDPLEIARRRYARGEITREEFEEIRAALR